MPEPDWDLLSSYAGLLFLASTSIYVGAFATLPNPKRAKGVPVDDDDDDDDDDDTERMSSDDAWLFPVIGSVALFGLYIIVKKFGTEWINFLLGWYFSIAGVGSVWQSSISLTRYLLGDTRWKQFDVCRVTAKKGVTILFAISWRTPSLFLFPVAALPSALYTFWSTSRKSVLITDILGLSFTHNALALLKIDSFKTGTILLSGLFVYDIWWVFGTEVMVKVATSLDIPIKLLWPKSLLFSDTRGFTMLGLGDIVIPGTFVALALRYDHHRFKRSTAKAPFFKPYFYAALSAYVLGLITTMMVMHMFGKAQPALLYLSPACICSFLFTALYRGELREAWEWSDDPEESTKTNGDTQVEDVDANSQVSKTEVEDKSS